jgi:hypothetical protein
MGQGGHFIVVIPAFDTVIVHRMDTEANKQIWSPQFGRFLKVLLAARMD